MASYGYFATGELQTQTLAGGTATFAYFTNGQLKQAQVPTVPPGPPVVADYVYGPDQLRIKRTVAGAPVYTLRGVGGEILSHYEAPCGALSWSRDDLYGAGRLLGSVRRAPTAFVAFVSAAGSVNEGTAQATVPVRVTTTNGQPLPCAATVSYQTTGGTATSDGDFAATSGTLTFPAGTASGTTLPITIPITNDTTDESDETLAVTLGTPTGASLGDPLIQPPQPATHTLTIVDNDLWPPLTINDVTVSESAGTATFTVTATGETALEVRVSYATVNGTARAGTDFTATTGTLVFEPGPPRTRTIAVPIHSDTWAEPTETFTVTLSNPVNATIADGTGVGTITDDDGPYQPINLALGGQFFADVDAGPTVDDYVLLANPHAVPVTVRFTAIRPNGSGLTRDVTVAAGSRTTHPLRTDPVVGGQGPLSLAVQSLNAATPIEADHAQYWGTNWDGGRATEGVTPAPVWYLAEGAVGYFEEALTVFNPQPVPVDVTIEAFTTAGAVLTRTERVESGPGRVRLNMRDWLGVVDHGTRVSAVRVDTGAPAAIVVERTMTWQADRREGHSTPGVSALSPTWYFAEGNRGIFDTYLAFLNVHPVPVTVRVSYLHSNGGRYMTDVVVAARSRATLPTPASVPTGDFGLDIVTLGGQGLAVERMVYGHTNWTVGHAAIGVPAPATAWRFAEGATGEFDTYFLVANPTASPSTVTFTFTLQTGGTVTTALAVPQGTRRYVLADTVAGLGTASFRTAVSATGPVVVERATYWWGVNGPSAMTAGDEPTVAGAETAGLTAATPTPVLDDGGGGEDPSPPVLYQEVVDATAIEVVPPAPLEGRTLLGDGGAVTPLAASLPWIGGHLTSGRRP